MNEETDLTLAAVLPLIDAARDSGFVVRHGFEAEDVSDRETKELLQLLHHEIGLGLRAILELHTVVSDARITLRMAKRYPWKNSIKRSDHLRLVWFQFINLCYMFKEKVKLTHNRVERVCNLLGIKTPTGFPGC